MPDMQIETVKKRPVYSSMIKTIGQQIGPPALLRRLMGAAEAYREKRKMGWSRPWNKYGLCTFQSFELAAHDDILLFEKAAAVLAKVDDVPAESLDFVNALVRDRDNLMGFIFLSEYREEGREYETATLSIGRKNPESSRHRDRFDIVLDAPINNRIAAPLVRMRIYVDPFIPTQKEPAFVTTVDSTLPALAVELFDTLAECSTLWANAEDKIWDHWSSKYVEYFGPRTMGVLQSHFGNS